MGTLYEVPKDEDWGGISLLPTERFISKSGRAYPKIERLTGENNDHWTVTI